MKNNPLTFRIFLKALAMSGLSITWIYAVAADRLGPKRGFYGNQQDAKGWKKDDYLVKSFDIIARVTANGEIKTNITVNLVETAKED